MTDFDTAVKTMNKTFAGTQIDATVDRYADSFKRLDTVGTNSMNAITARLTSAQTALSAIKSSASSAAQGLEGGSSIIPNSGDIVGSVETSASIIDNLTTAANNMSTYRMWLQTLKDDGLSYDLLQQLVAAGPVQGYATARALVDGGPKLVSQADLLQSSINSNSTAIGNFTSSASYQGKQVGLSTAQGIIAGLQSQKKAVEQELINLASGMKIAIERALNINSPSKVFAEIGGHVVDGLALGVSSNSMKAHAAMGDLAKELTAGASSLGARMSGQAARAAAGNPSMNGGTYTGLNIENATFTDEADIVAVSKQAAFQFRGLGL